MRRKRSSLRRSLQEGDLDARVGKLCDAIIYFDCWNFAVNNMLVRDYVKNGGYIVLQPKRLREIVRVILQGKTASVNESVTSYLKNSGAAVQLSDEELKKYADSVGMFPDYIAVVDPMKLKRVMRTTMCDYADIVYGAENDVILRPKRLTL